MSVLDSPEGPIHSCRRTIDNRRHYEEVNKVKKGDILKLLVQPVEDVEILDVVEHDRPYFLGTPEITTINNASYYVVQVEVIDHIPKSFVFTYEIAMLYRSMRDDHGT